MPKANSKSSKQKTNKCSRCHSRHLLPTGAKCTQEPALEELEAQLDDDDFQHLLGFLAFALVFCITVFINSPLVKVL
jgi:hypothetical protein